MRILIFYFILFPFNLLGQNLKLNQIGYIKYIEKNKYAFSNFILFDTSICLRISSNIKLLYQSSFYSRSHFSNPCYFFLPNDYPNSLTLFPNPATNFITLKNIQNLPIKSIDRNIIYDLTIYDIFGYKKFQSKLNYNDIVSGYKIDISHFPSGTYLLILKSTNFSYSTIKFNIIN